MRQVLYLIFNEGYTASSGPSLHRVELSAEAIRLTRQLRARLGDGETAALLALAADRRAPAGARRRPTPPSPRTTGWTPCAPTCSRWPASRRPRARRTGRPRAAR